MVEVHSEMILISAIVALYVTENRAYFLLVLPNLNDPIPLPFH